MARILFGWELGGGLGHIAKIIPLARELETLGHEIFIASPRARAFLQHAEFAPGALIEVPDWPTPRHPPRIEMQSYADVLRMVGYENVDLLARQIGNWRHVIETVRPDAVVGNASPTFQLALRGSGIPLTLIGTGFEIPPATCPLPPIKFWEPVPSEVLLAKEHRLLLAINAALQRNARPRLTELRQLFEADRIALTTIRELDHYRNRGNAHYVGNIDYIEGSQPEWPTADGPKVFAYLKPFPELPKLIKALVNQQCSVLLHGPKSVLTATSAYAATGISRIDTLIDSTYSSRSCDIAISNAGHGTAVCMLLSAKPMLCFPLYVEQHITATLLNHLQAAELCSPWHSNEIEMALTRLILKQKTKQAHLPREQDMKLESARRKLAEHILMFAS